MKKQMKQPIFLCGMMGAGKSTAGRPLAKKLKAPFHDLDQIIEEYEQQTIPEIFENRGENYFREIEQNILIAQTDGVKGVMALGGGSLQNQHVVDHIKLHGWLVYLKPPFETLMERLQNRSGRPMISDYDTEQLNKRIHRLINARAPFYNQAHVTIKTATLSPDQIAERIIKKLTFYDQ